MEETNLQDANVRRELPRTTRQARTRHTVQPAAICRYQTESLITSLMKNCETPSRRNNPDPRANVPDGSVAESMSHKEKLEALELVRYHSAISWRTQQADAELPMVSDREMEQGRQHETAEPDLEHSNLVQELLETDEIMENSDSGREYMETYDDAIVSNLKLLTDQDTEIIQEKVNGSIDDDVNKNCMNANARNNGVQKSMRYSGNRGSGFDQLQRWLIDFAILLMFVVHGIPQSLEYVRGVVPELPRRVWRFIGIYSILLRLIVVKAVGRFVTFTQYSCRKGVLFESRRRVKRPRKMVLWNGNGTRASVTHVSKSERQKPSIHETEEMSRMEQSTEKWDTSVTDYDRKDFKTPQKTFETTGRGSFAEEFATHISRGEDDSRNTGRSKQGWKIKEWVKAFTRFSIG